MVAHQAQGQAKQGRDLSTLAPTAADSTVALRCPPLVRVQRLIIEPMQERQRERIVPQSLHLPGPDSPSGASVAVHVGVKRFEGDVDTPWTAGGVISIAEDTLQSVNDIGAALGGDMVADPNVHARALTYWLPRSDDGLEIAYCCRMELNEFQ